MGTVPTAYFNFIMDYAPYFYYVPGSGVDTVGETLWEGLELLSRVGLNDAFLFVRRYSQLSDGQKYRYRIAKTIESGRQY